MTIDGQVDSQIKFIKNLQDQGEVDLGINDSFDFDFIWYHDSEPPVNDTFTHYNGAVLGRRRSDEDCCDKADKRFSTSLTNRRGAVICDAGGTPIGFTKKIGPKTFTPFMNMSVNGKVYSICGGIYGHNASAIKDSLFYNQDDHDLQENWNFAVLIDELVIPTPEGQLTHDNSMSPLFCLDPLRMFHFGTESEQSVFFRLLFSRRDEFREKLNAKVFFRLNAKGELIETNKPSI